MRASTGRGTASSRGCPLKRTGALERIVPAGNRALLRTGALRRPALLRTGLLLLLLAHGRWNNLGLRQLYGRQIGRAHV